MKSDTIKAWFLSHRRSLPWRENPTPYRVWVSEVMLQQTQVAVVIPYFERWMARFPTIKALAEAPIEVVVKTWEGLGYYSRARNLHAGARQVVTDFGGELPATQDELASIKGIGPYTCGAILSFAFRQKAAAVDGNVTRVISRLFTLDGSMQAITQNVEALLPDDAPWLVVEGLIELGATVCKKTPLCAQCPLQQECLAFRHQKQHAFPPKKARPKTTVLHRHVAVIECEGKFLLQKGEKGKVMADLYAFPFIEEVLGIKMYYEYSLPEQQHTFTRYRVHLYPHRFRAEKVDARYEWKGQEELEKLPFSSGHRRILHTL